MGGLVLVGGHHFRQSAMEPISKRPKLWIHWRIANRAAKSSPSASSFRLGTPAAYSKMGRPLYMLAVIATRMDFAKMQARAI